MLDANGRGSLSRTHCALLDSGEGALLVVDATLRGLERAVQLYSLIPGDAAMRAVKEWTRTAAQLLGDAPRA